MKERYVDIALISALVLIAATIVYTLFVPGRPRVQAGTAPQVTGVAIQPETPDAPPSADAVPVDVVPVVPSDTPDAPSEATVEEQARAATNELASSTDPAPEEATSPAPLPEGAIDLERVGFSFVTGGVGSCNIVLEPWQHVAVSLDLREKYPCGSEITITLNEEVAGRTSFTAIVGDSIRNAERTVNVYVGQDEPALEYGIKDGSLSQ
jgi:type IV secretory pathway VirB10-like protein